MKKEIYQSILREIENKKSPFILKQGDSIYIIKGNLFNTVLENFPPYLNKANALVPLSSLYTIFFHTKTNSLVIANKGASLLSKSALSGRYMVVRHVGFIVYLPNQGIEIIDVGISGNLKKSKFAVLRPESACSPGFMFGSQRCNCYDQWTLTQELAIEYNKIEKPNLSPVELENFLTSHMSSDESNNILSKSDGQAFIMAHFTSQNGMGSGVIENNFVRDLTANAFIRHRGEYSAEQIHKVSVAGGFDLMGITRDPRKLNNYLSFKLISIILDYFNTPKKIVVLTNNVDKINALINTGYDIRRLQIVARAGDGCEIEIDNRRNEFGHLIPEDIYVSWKEELVRLKKEIDSLL